MGNGKEESKSSQNLLENKTWFRNLTAVQGLVGGFLIILFSALITWICSRKDIADRIVLVLDSSKVMVDSFDTGLKYQAAIKVLESQSTGISETDKISIRLFGGDCNEEPKNRTRPLLSFGSHTGSKLVATYKKYANGPFTGDAMVASGVVEAISELKDFKDVNKKIVVIAGGVKACACEADPLKVIKDRFNLDDPKGEIQRDLQFIGLRIESDQRNLFREIAEKAIGGLALFVENDADLNFVIHRTDLARIYLKAQDFRLYPTSNKDDSTAIKYFEEFISGSELSEDTEIKNRVAEAMRYMGDIYADTTPPQEDTTAFDWYKRSADRGNKEGTYQVGLAYEDSLGVKADLDSAYTYYKKAYELGHEEAEEGFKRIAEKIGKITKK